MFGLDFLRQWKEWVTENRKSILLLGGIFLVGAVSFESGLIRGQLARSEPLVISIPAVVEPTIGDKALASAEGRANQGTEAGRTAPKTGEEQASGQCPFVGSRNSNKYHSATCAVVKRIKPENRICFASKEEAEKRGYVASCLK